MMNEEMRMLMKTMRMKEGAKKKESRSLRRPALQRGRSKRNAREAKRNNEDEGSAEGAGGGRRRGPEQEGEREGRKEKEAKMKQRRVSGNNTRTGGSTCILLSIVYRSLCLCSRLCLLFGITMWRYVSDR